MKYSIIKRLSLYTVFSGLAALVNFGSRFGYEALLGGATTSARMAYLVSVAAAYLTGMIVNFVLSKYVTFQAQESGRTQREIIKFVAIALIGLVATVAGSFVAYETLVVVVRELPGLKFSDDLLRTLGHVAGMGIGLVVNFIGHDRLSFRQTGLWDRVLLALKRGRESGEQSEE